ncbi:unnamed protein product, partial [Brassica napus]
VNFNQPCGNYLSLFYKSSLSSSLSVFLSYRFFTNNQSEPPQKEREKNSFVIVIILRKKSTMGIVVKSFKDQFSSDERLKESSNIIAKYPDRVPVIIEKYSNADLPDMEKSKFLVPRDMTVGHFIHMLSNRLQLDPSKALFVFVQNTLPQTGT